MTNAQAWDYAVGMIKVDGLEPTEEFKALVAYNAVFDDLGDLS